MVTLALLLLLLGAQVPPVAGHDGIERIFARGTTFAEFVSRAASQRPLWTRPVPAGGVPVDLSVRLLARVRVRQ